MIRVLANQRLHSRVLASFLRPLELLFTRGGANAMAAMSDTREQSGRSPDPSHSLCYHDMRLGVRALQSSSRSSSSS